MGIYWCCVDEQSKEYFEPPEDFANKTPGLYHPNNPFPGMMVMMNSRGSRFELINDMGYEGPYGDHADKYRNITAEVYKDYVEQFQG